MVHTESQAVSKAFVSEARLLFLFLISIFFLTSAGFDSSEGRYHYMIAHQMLTKGALGYEEKLFGTFTVGPNGRTYASHEIGNSILMLPVAAVNIGIEKALEHRMEKRRVEYVTGFLVCLMPAIVCAFTTALLYILLRLGFQKPMRTALESCLAFAFCTYLWSYTRNAFDGVLCMCVLTGAMLSMVQFRKTLDTRLFVVATTLLGFGVITRISMLLPVAAFALYVTMILWEDRARLVRLAIIGAAILAPFAVWQMYYNHLRTGLWLISPVQSAQYADNNGFTGNLAVGLAGLLLSPGKSIFVYVPLGLLSIVCFRRFRASCPFEATFVGVLLAFWVLLHAKLANWFGAWGWGPRHFVTITPILVLPACVAWEWIKENVWRRSLLQFALAWGLVLAASSIIGNWAYRTHLAVMRGQYDDMLWSPTRGQALDMVIGAVSNLRNIVTHQVSGPVLEEHSATNAYAANTVNVWINSAAYQGMPRIVLAAVACALLALAGYSFWALCRMMQSGTKQQVVVERKARAVAAGA
jgi:hypothetical protein